MGISIRLTNIEGECNSSGKNQGTDQLDENDKLHTETERAAEVLNKNQFHQVMNRRVNPSSSLGE